MSKSPEINVMRTRGGATKGRGCPDSRLVRTDSERANTVASREDIAASLNETTFESTAAVLAKRWSLEAQCRVLLASCDSLRRRFSLAADSAREENARLLKLGDPIEQALAEAMLLQPLALKQGLPPELPLQEQLAECLQMEAVQIVLFTDDAGTLQGAALLAGKSTTSSFIQLERRLRRSSALFAAYLRLRREASNTVWQRLRSTLGSLLRSKRNAILLAVATAVILSLLLPVPHRVGARCVCEPSASRLVVAPFDGRLLTSHAKPGDRVHEGQALAAFDGGDTHAEIAAIKALIRQSRQRHKAAIINGSASEAAKELSELERLGQELDVLQRRAEQLVLLSPITGIVVSGDLESAKGAAVPIGKPLYEIAPAGQLLSEIEVEESDIRFIELGQEVSLTFHGDFKRSYKATVRRIRPRSEERLNKNTFVVETDVISDCPQIAAGMTGHARVHTGWQSLGQLLFHKPYYAMARYWGWF